METEGLEVLSYKALESKLQKLIKFLDNPYVISL